LGNLSIKFHKAKNHQKTMEEKKMLCIKNFKLLQTFDKAKLSGTNLLLNFKTILIVYNGWVSVLNVNWIHVFMPHALVYQV
jgi:hypothetical protein